MSNVPWVCRKSCRWMTGTPAGDPLECLGDGMRVDGSAFGVGEDPAGIVNANGVVLGGLQCPPAARHRHGGGVEVDGAPGVGGLAA